MEVYQLFLLIFKNYQLQQQLQEVHPQLWPKIGYVPKSQLLVLLQEKFYPLLLLELMQDNGANL